MVPILEMIRRQVMQRIIERKRKANNLSQSELAKQYMFHVASGKSVVFHVNMHMVQYWRKEVRKRSFQDQKAKKKKMTDSQKETLGREGRIICKQAGHKAARCKENPIQKLKAKEILPKKKFMTKAKVLSMLQSGFV